MKMKLVYWCNRKKEKISLKDQGSCGSHCSFTCCCPSTIIDGSEVDNDSQFWCPIHEVGVEEFSDAHNYCLDCSQLKKKVTVLVKANELGEKRQ